MVAVDLLGKASRKRAEDCGESRSSGKERDSETGLDYFGARYYGSTMGRWLTPDWSAEPEPVPYAQLGEPQSLNLYAYVGNRPVTLVDSTGHCPPCIDWLVAKGLEWLANNGPANMVGAALSGNGDFDINHVTVEDKKQLVTGATTLGFAVGMSNVGELENPGDDANEAQATSTQETDGALAERVQQIHETLSPVTQDKVTTAVGTARNADGRVPQPLILCIASNKKWVPHPSWFWEGWESEMSAFREASEYRHLPFLLPTLRKPRRVGHPHLGLIGK